MEIKRTQHSVRVRDDLWEILLSYMGDKPVQDFFESCIIEKTGLNGNEAEEISKTDKEILRLQELNNKRKEFFKNKKAGEDDLEQLRLKALKGFLDKPLEGWTASNKKVTIEDGKFNDWKEAEEWIRKHQESQKESGNAS